MVRTGPFASSARVIGRGALVSITVAPIAVVLGAILAVNVTTNAERTISLTKREMDGAVRTLSDRFDGELKRAAQMADQMARAATVLSRSRQLGADDIYALLEQGVLQDPLIYGAAMAFVAGGFDGRPAFSPYVHRTGTASDTLQRLDIADAYDYQRDPQARWFTEPVATGQPMWSEPYFDEGAGNIMMATYSAPFPDASGRLLGVTTVDIPLAPLQDFVGTDLDVVVLTSTGRYVFRTDGIPEGSPTVFEHAAARPDKLAMAGRMVAGETGMAEIADPAGEPLLAFFAPLPSAGWSYATYLPKAEALAGARREAWWLAGNTLLALGLIALAMWFVAGLVVRSQAESRASERRVRRLVESAPDAMVIVDRDGTIVMVNDQAEATFGFAAADMVGRSMNMLVPERFRPDHDEMLAEFFSRPARRTMGSDLNISAIRADGTEFPIEVGLSPLETTDGLLVSSVIRDITDRRRAEDELAQQRILLASTIDTIPDIIFHKDFGGRYVQCNPACAELIGKARAEIVGKTDYDLWDKPVADQFLEDDRRVMTSGEPWTYEEWVTYRDGARRLLETTKVPYRDDAGTILGVLGIARDITDRHEAAEALSEGEERQRLILESTGEGIFGVDGAGRLMFMNGAAVDLLGYAKDELLGRAIHDIIHHTRADGRPYPVEECPMHIAFTAGLASKVDDEVLWRKDGTSFDVEYTSSPVEKDGEVVGAVIVFRDISERKVAEAELLQARDEAQAADRAKSAFLANMSHELRTPMNAILGYSDILIEEYEDLAPEEFLPDLEKIRAAGRHLLGLIDDILAVSRIEAGTMSLDVRTFVVEDVVRDIAGTMCSQVKKRGNSFELSVDGDLGSMHSDPARVRQVLMNLVSNATKFTRDGRIELRAARRQADTGRDWLEFTVSDTGIGIPAEKIESLFKEFTQADESSTREYGGTGMGLAITQRFCTLLGGTIRCESAVGVGSTFTVRLPAEIDAPDTAKPDVSAA